jgi:uncharacterized protein
MTIDEKYNQLQRILKKLGKVIVAYSGGVDSTFLLKACVETIGSENVSACIAAGPSLPKSQYDKALEMAKDIGVNVETVASAELTDPAYSANKADRCFHCKSHLYKILNNLAKEKGFDNVVCGSNLDDFDDFRPGNRAAKVFNVKYPLAEAKLTKADIRQLPTADIPASPCLASRISYGIEITEQKLKQVEDAEEFLKILGFVEFRLRHHDKVARIEVRKSDIAKIIEEPVRQKVVEKLKSLGFKFITIDLEGFRSGSLNELLSEEEKRESL